MKQERDDFQNSYFYDGKDCVIHDEPFEPTGEMAYREKMKAVKKPGKKSNPKK